MAFLEPKLRDYDTDLLYKLVEILVSNAFDYCNETFDRDPVTLLEFVEDIKKHCATFTVPELRIMFKKGCMCAYGNPYKLSYQMFFKWINIYMMDEDRLRLRRMVENREVVTEKILSQEEKDKIVYDAILGHFEAYKKGGRGIMVTSASTYDYLCDLKIIEISIDEKKRIADLAFKKLKEEAIRDKGKLSIKAKVDAITRHEIALESKRIAVSEYFDLLISFDDELEQIIIDAKKDLERERNV